MSRCAPPYTNGEAVPLGTNFSLTATPGAGAAFYTWNNGTQITDNLTVSNTMSNGLTLTATFVPSTTNKGITITSPAANARLSTNTFAVKGKILSGFKPTEITCQVFQTNGLAVGPPMTTTSTATSTWSVTASNIPGGIYFVEAVATNDAGVGMVATQPFSVLSFAAAEGMYTGLFICTNVPVAATNSGYFQFTVNSSGAFSGKLAFPAFPTLPVYNLEFVNIDNTTGYFTNLTTSHVPEAPLGIVIYLDLSGGSETAVGTISGSGWSSQLTCHRAVANLSASTTPATGRYIFSLQNQSQTNGPYTNGYVALTIAKNGVMSLIGALPDDTTFSQSTRVSQGGAWPLYAAPGGDKNNGVLLGWETFTNLVNCNGQLYWYKGSNVGAYYTSGVGVRSNMLLTATGTNFLRPTPGSQYSIVFEGGPLTAPLTNALMATDSGQWVVSGGAADHLRISLSANGVLSGSILNAAVNETVRFKGAFIGPSQGGSGFIIGTDGQTGSFALQPVAVP